MSGIGREASDDRGQASLHRVSGVLPRRRAMPRGGKIGGRQRILGVLVCDGTVRGGLTVPTGIVAATLFPLQIFGHEVIEHSRASLRSGAELARDMGTDRTGVRLTRAELTQVAHGRRCGRDGVRRGDLASLRLV